MRQPARVRDLLDRLFQARSKAERHKVLERFSREELLDIYQYVTPQQFRVVPLWCGRWIDDPEVVAAHLKAHRRMERAAVREQRANDPVYVAQRRAIADRRRASRRARALAQRLREMEWL